MTSLRQLEHNTTILQLQESTIKLLMAAAKLQAALGDREKAIAIATKAHEMAQKHSKLLDETKAGLLAWEVEHGIDPPKS